MSKDYQAGEPTANLPKYAKIGRALEHLSAQTLWKQLNLGYIRTQIIRHRSMHR